MCGIIRYIRSMQRGDTPVFTTETQSHRGNQKSECRGSYEPRAASFEQTWRLCSLGAQSSRLGTSSPAYGNLYREFLYAGFAAASLRAKARTLNRKAELRGTQTKRADGAKARAIYAALKILDGDDEWLFGLCSIAQQIVVGIIRSGDMEFHSDDATFHTQERNQS